LERTAGAVGASRQDLREDRERRLGRRDRADVEAARAGDPLERVLGNARLQQPLAASLLVAAGTERPT